MYLGDDYKHTEGIDVTDIVSGLAESRARSDYRGESNQRSLDRARLERDKGTY